MCQVTVGQTSPPSVQSAVKLYARALQVPRLLFDLYGDPMPSGPPEKKFRGIPPSVVQSVTAAFEAFAEELCVIALLRQRESWAQIAMTADMTNPTPADLCTTLKDQVGIEISTPASEGSEPWTAKIWEKANPVQHGWWTRSRKMTWGELLSESKAWMQVRHCLTHGLVTGTEPAFWPGPVAKKASQRAAAPPASSVLEERSGGRRSLTMYPAINCALVYSWAGAEIANQVAQALGESVIVDGLLQFEW